MMITRKDTPVSPGSTCPTHPETLQGILMRSSLSLFISLSLSLSLFISLSHKVTTISWTLGKLLIVYNADDCRYHVEFQVKKKS